MVMLSAEDGGGPIAARIESAIRKLQPTPIPPGIDRNQILAATEHDKKNTGTARIMVLPREVGRCEIVSDVTEEEVTYGIDSILA